MVSIWDIKRKNAFGYILLRKTLSYFASLAFFHYDDNICPRNLLCGYRPFIVKPCRFDIKPILENLFSGLASVLVLVAYKQNVHHNYSKFFLNLNLVIMATIMLPLASAYSIGVSPDKVVFEDEDKSGKQFTILNPNDEEIMFEIENEYFDFSPQNSTIAAKSSKAITARALKDEPAITNIVIKLKKDSAVVPGAVLKAEIKAKDRPEMDDYTFNWLLVFLSTIIFGFLGFVLLVEILKWLRGG
jgi:hypothetical protein